MPSTDSSVKLECRLERSAAARRSASPLARCAAALALCSCLLVPASSRAEAPSAAATAQADAAFEEGRELFEQGRFKEACEKFEVSQGLDPSPGTLLNLGNCYEPQGDLLRALATFERALEGAQRAPDRKRRQVWSDAARERIASLGKRLAHLTVDDAEPGSRVSLDGQPFETLGQEVRQNPGRHQLEVSAPGKRTYSKNFDLPEGQRLSIALPPLEPERVAPEPVSTPEPVLATLAPDAPSESRFGVWPWVVGGTGAALLGTSLVTGLMASSKASQLEEECGSDGRCDPSLESVRDDAKSLALTTDVLWISGAVFLGAGVTLFILDQQSSPDATALEAGCFDSGCGLRTRGRF
jgi:Tfp pilus assembly protein PilF